MTAKVPGERYRLQLFITGMSPRSSQAVASIKAFCEDVLPGRYDLEIIDLYRHPERARENDIVAAPTLVKLDPPPRRRLAGTLTSREQLFRTLDVPPP